MIYETQKDWAEALRKEDQAREQAVKAIHQLVNRRCFVLTWEECKEAALVALSAAGRGAEDAAPDEVVVRVARAIQKANRPNHDTLNPDQRENLESQTLAHYLHLARAALSAAVERRYLEQRDDEFRAELARLRALLKEAGEALSCVPSYTNVSDFRRARALAEQIKQEVGE